MIEVNYHKRKNQELFKSLEEKKLLFISKTQNFIPIYQRFFNLNETNYNNIKSAVSKYQSSSFLAEISSFLKKIIFTTIYNPYLYGILFQKSKKFIKKKNSTIINHSIKTNYLNRKSRANMQPKSKAIWFARMKDTKKIILIDDYCDDLIENYIFSTGFAGIELKNNSLYFLWNYINSKDIEDIKNRYSTGTTQKSITNEGIEKIKILIPSQDLLNIFDSKLSSNCFQILPESMFFFIRLPYISLKN